MGRSVFLSGATGSFGHAFVRRALDCGARRVVAFSRDELKQAKMREQFPDERMRWFLGDCRDAERLSWAVQGCDTVIHAAALKRIEACESNPWEAVSTNVVGTQNVADAAIRAGIAKACFLSTDKAPNAATLYGGTKFVAERLWCASNVYSRGGTKLSAVRYGNVLGSRGSVLDIWRGQIARNEYVTITDKAATRFWLTIEQAVDLVVLCLSEMRGGEVFVPKAPSSPIGALVSALAGRNGYPTQETGLRPAERLHETLISSDEARYTYDCGTHYTIEPPERSWGDVPALPFPRVPEDFELRSDTNPTQIAARELRGLVAA